MTSALPPARRRLSVFSSTTLGHDLSLAMEQRPTRPTLECRTDLRESKQQEPPAPPPSPVDFSSASHAGWFDAERDNVSGAANGYGAFERQ